MSFSTTLIGTPAGVKRALAAEVAKYTGQSRLEFEQVQPHLEGLLDQVVGSNKVVTLRVSGHATFNHVDGADVKTDGNVSVALDQTYGTIALDAPPVPTVSTSAEPPVNSTPGQAVNGGGLEQATAATGHTGDNPASA